MKGSPVIQSIECDKKKKLQAVSDGKSLKMKGIVKKLNESMAAPSGKPKF